LTSLSTKDRIKIIAEDVVWRGWAKITRVCFNYQRSDGHWQEQTREIYERGHGATVLLYDPKRRTVVLTKQFRLACLIAGDDGMLLEAAAGMLEEDDPEDCIRREIEEETGFRIAKIEKLFEAYSTPGSVTEKLHYYAAAYDPGLRVSAGGGSVSEGEDIEVVELNFETAFNMVASGEIQDAKTIILLQYAKLAIF
jgi:nudix-type nucleoside diphosphatase (YffH/AdpP family)